MCAKREKYASQLLGTIQSYVNIWQLPLYLDTNTRFWQFLVCIWIVCVHGFRGSHANGELSLAIYWSDHVRGEWAYAFDFHTRAINAICSSPKVPVWGWKSRRERERAALEKRGEFLLLFPQRAACMPQSRSASYTPRTPRGDDARCENINTHISHTHIEVYANSRTHLRPSARGMFLCVSANSTVLFIPDPCVQLHHLRTDDSACVVWYQPRAPT